MKPEEIKAELVRRKIKSREIANEAKVSAPLVSLVISGKTFNKNVQSIISQKIGLPIEKVFSAKEAA